MAKIGWNNDTYDQLDLIQHDIRLQWQMYIPWNFSCLMIGESNMADPVPFFRGRTIPLFPFPAPVLAWL